MLLRKQHRVDQTLASDPEATTTGEKSLGRRIEDLKYQLIEFFSGGAKEGQRTGGRTNRIGQGMVHSMGPWPGGKKKRVGGREGP